MVLISLGRRSVEGESVSEPVATADRVRLVESWAVEDIASLRDDSVNWGLEALMGKIELEVFFGDTMTVK